MIAIRGVSHSYERTENHIFQNVTAEFYPGQAFTIEGPSGVGKSTLLSILGGFVTPTDGTLELPDSFHKEVAWISQTNTVFSHRRVIQNARFLADLDGSIDNIDDKVDSTLRVLGLEELGDRRAGSLSGGERQRLCIARALISGRRYILADEPTSQLDRASAARTMAALGGASNQGKCVVVVTHDVDVVTREFSRMVLTIDGLHSR